MTLRESQARVLESISLVMFSERRQSLTQKQSLLGTMRLSRKWGDELTQATNTVAITVMEIYCVAERVPSFSFKL
jgi:hypothetical protein